MKSFIAAVACLLAASAFGAEDPALPTLSGRVVDQDQAAIEDVVGVSTFGARLDREAPGLEENEPPIRAVLVFPPALIGRGRLGDFAELPFEREVRRIRRAAGRDHR